MNTVTEVAALRQKAAEDAAAIGLLDAVQTIARKGEQHGYHSYVNDWNGYRFYYGERFGDPERPYAEVHVLRYSKTHPVHEKPKSGVPFAPGNPDDAVTGCELIYKVTDNNGVGETVCFRSGKWTDEVVAEAKRLGTEKREAPSAAGIEDAKKHFEPHNG